MRDLRPFMHDLYTTLKESIVYFCSRSSDCWYYANLL